MGGAQVCLLPEHLGGGLSLTGQQTGGSPSTALDGLPLVTRKHLHPKARGERTPILSLWHRNLGTFGSVGWKSLVSSPERRVGCPPRPFRPSEWPLTPG